MSEAKRIKTALVSVYHKEGLEEIITKLHEEGVEFLSTGGTRQFIESLGFPCKAVEDLTTYPSILGGRVKTLHPKVFGGILCRRGLEQDMQQIEKYEIPDVLGALSAPTHQNPFSHALTGSSARLFILFRLSFAATSHSL